MTIGVETSALAKNFGIKEAIQIIKASGIDSIDFSYYWMSDEVENCTLGDEYDVYAREMHEYLNRIEMKCHQAHAPFEVVANQVFDSSNRKYLQLLRSIKSANILGAKNIVVHAVSTQIDENLRFYQALERDSQDLDIKISIENLFTYENECFGSMLGTPEEMNDLINLLDSDRFNFCLDVGHAQLTSDGAANFALRLKRERLKCLHIHDNNGNDDTHTIPFLGTINWSGFKEALATIKYDGVFTFEVFNFLNRFTNKETAISALRLVKSIGQELVNE